MKVLRQLKITEHRLARVAHTLCCNLDAGNITRGIAVET
jgi:hypothetical protein